MTRKFTSAVAGLILVILVAAPKRGSRRRRSAPAVAVSAPRDDAAAPTTQVKLLVGRSTILDIGGTITRVSLTVPDIADAMVTAPTQLLIHGKQPGTISMFVWDKMGAIKTYEVVVRRDLSSLVEHVKQLFPGEPISVAGSGKDVVLSGTVTSKYVIDKAADVAAGYVEKKENVVNLLKQQEGVASNQVLLKRPFRGGQPQRAAGSRRRVLQRRQERPVRPRHDATVPGAPFRPQSAERGVGRHAGVQRLPESVPVRREEQDRCGRQGAADARRLPEPRRAESDRDERQGGQLPRRRRVPLSGSAGAVRQLHDPLQGVRRSTELHADRARRRSDQPEDQAGSQLSRFQQRDRPRGLPHPGADLAPRRDRSGAPDGQTFAIAGLLNNTALSSMRKIPGLGDIPILGYLFKSKAYTKDQTELVVMVTPTIVRRDSTGVSPGLPSLVEPYLGPNEKPIVPPAPYVGSPHPQSKPGGRSGDDAPQAQPMPETVATTPIQAAAPLPVVDKKAQKKAAEAAEKQRVVDEKQQAEAAKRQAEADKDAAKKAEKLEKERAKQQAEADKKAEEARKKSSGKTDQTKQTGGQ